MLGKPFFTTQYFFHIDHNTPYTCKRLHQPGDVIETSSRSSNPYYDMAMDFHHEYPSVGSRCFPLLAFFGEAARQKASQVLPDVVPIMDSHLKIIRELVFESVRAENFAHLPSGSKCLWLCQSVDEARSWIERLDGRTNTRILRVTVEGRLHTTLEGHLHQDSQPMGQIIASANRYWRGEQVPGSRSETLLEGKMTVIDVL